MSVSREVIASICEVKPEEIKRETCKAFSGLLWCNAWNLMTRGGDFCTFWEEKEEGE